MIGLSSEVDLVGVQVFDAKWGRPARAKKGLYAAVLNALDTTIEYPRDARHPPPVLPPRQISDDEFSALVASKKCPYIIGVDEQR